VARPKDLQQLGITDLLRIELDQQRFAVIANPLIIWRFRRPSGIADDSPYDTWQAPEPGVDSPESAQGEQRRFCDLRKGQVNLRSLP
jgi:hypothetical protein